MTQSAPVVGRCAWLVLAALALPVAAEGQLCHGTPAAGGIAFERGGVTFGNTNGVSAAFGGGRTSVGLAARMIDRDEDISSYGTDLRFSLKFPAGKVVICPGLGVGYERGKWEPAGVQGEGFSLTSNTLGLRAGVAVGMEQKVYRDLSVIPFIGVRYEFRVVYLDLKADDGENNAAGDTLSLVDIEYGLTARYKFAYLGWGVHRNSEGDGNRPYFSRLLLGFTWDRGGRGDRR